MRSVVIGLHGCSWNVLDRVLDSGKLPNLARLRDESASGVLRSTVPFFAGPAWASFATGTSPAAHGIYDLLLPSRDGELEVAGRSRLRRQTYYEQLGDEGRRSVLINMPLDQGGCQGALIVNSWVTDDERRRILPVGRRERYRRLLASYTTFPDDPSNVEQLCSMERARFDLAREMFLGESWDHFFVLFSSPDLLGHCATGALLRGEPEAMQLFIRLYRDIDRYIGWFVDHADDALVAVLSDHGQTEETAVFRVNTLLKELGLLRNGHGTVNAPVRDGGDRARFRVSVPSRVPRLRKKPVVGPAVTLTKKALRKGLSIDVTRASQAVDRSTSQAFAPTDASFAIYARDLEPPELDRVRAALLAQLLPDGRNAIEGVWTPEELYGRSDPDGPALVFAPAAGVRPSATLGLAVVEPSSTSGRGCHDRDGIVMLAGNGVRPGELETRSIYDIAPTLLWAMGSPILGDGDGRILQEAFTSEARDDLSVSEVEASVRSDRVDEAASEDVARRLKALGYI